MNGSAILERQVVPEWLPNFRARVAEDLRLLALLHDREPDTALLLGLRKIGFPACLTLTLDDEAGAEGAALMRQALAESPQQASLDDLAADYAGIYLNHHIGASPQESVWIDEDSLACQQSMFQVRACYASHGLEVPDWRLRADDHLVYQLQFVAQLLGKDHDLQSLEEAAIFMDEHLLRWLGNFGERVLKRCSTAYFAGAAAVTAAYCEELRDILAELLQQPRPSFAEIEKRMQPRRQQQAVPVAFVPGLGPAV